MLKMNWHKISKNCKTIKLKILMLYKFMYAIPPIIRFLKDPCQQRKRILRAFWLWIFKPTYYFKESIFNGRQTILVYKNYYAIAVSLNSFISLAWFCEKMQTNIKVEYLPNAMWHHFENDGIINTVGQQEQNLGKQEKYHSPLDLAPLGLFSNSSKYGHKILSKLSIKDELKHTADQWYKQHIEGDWVAVHYRGTDIAAAKEMHIRLRYRINLNHYIIYLKEVLDSRCSIFACSDQAQFINKMHEAFPGRVITRNIQRSHDDTPLHNQGHYQQEKDALIDILVLAKAKLVYTSGSGFIDVVRYFNPEIKVVALDGRGRGRISGNVLPIPKKNLFNKLRMQ